MKKQVVTLFCGCSASGKSTRVKELRDAGWKFVELNRDEWRFKLFTDGVQDWSKYKFTKEREQVVTDKLNELFDSAVRNLMPVIVSNTNLNKKDHNYWENKAKQVGYDFEVVYFHESLTTLLKRDKKRGALAVGQDVIFDQWQKWLEITNSRKYVPNEFKPKAIILDIDGTIALTNGRSHYDYSDAVLTDVPRIDVIDLVTCYANSTGAEIICVSGREDKCKEYTQSWLDTYYVDNSGLYMRKTSDDRCDTIVKEEIFWNDIEPYYNIIAAVDDRPRVIRKWKDIGIPLVISVQTDYKEF
jgi:predicted kinase